MVGDQIMSQPAPQPLTKALVDLADAVEQTSGRHRREAASRNRMSPLSANELAVLNRLMRHPNSGARQLVDSLGLSTAQVRRLLANLELNGLVLVNADGGKQTTYVVTNAALELRAAARERAAHYIGYALASMTAEDQLALSEAAKSLQALTVALGFRDI